MYMIHEEKPGWVVVFFEAITLPLKNKRIMKSNGKDLMGCDSVTVRNLCLHTHISDLVLKQSYNAHVPNSWRDRAHTDAKQLMCIQEWLRNYPWAFFSQLTQKYRVLYFWIVGLEDL